MSAHEPAGTRPPDGGEVAVTYLEMLEPPAGAARRSPDGVDVVRAEQPTVAFYRFLYDTVGEPWRWVDRRRLADDALRAAIQDPGVAVHVLYHRGTPAGYAELDYRRPPDVELVYFGLMPEFIGHGLGAFFLDWMIREAWRGGAGRLWVHTCTLDHPAALPLYQKHGFRPYRRELRAAS